MMSFLLVALQEPFFQEQTLGGPWRTVEIGPAGTLTVGVEYERTAVRRLNQSVLRCDLPGSVGQSTDLELRGYSVCVRAGYSLLNLPDGKLALEVYGLGGLADYRMTGLEIDALGTPWNFLQETNIGSLWGVGAKARIFSQSGFTIMSDVSFRISLHETEQLGFNNIYFQTQSSRTAISTVAWTQTVSYGIETSILTFFPYAGFHLSFLTLDSDGSGTPYFSVLTGNFTFRAIEEKSYGLTAGIEVLLGARYSFFAEVRLIDETAVSVGLRASM